jgi:ferredoxin
MHNVHTLIFSPTKTTEEVVNTIAHDLSGKVYTHNITHKAPADKIELSKDDITIVGVPVYGGRVPQVALERMQHIRSAGGVIVLVAVYGNRHYDDIFQELHNWSTEAGFIPIAAGAFVGEHSFSTKSHPIAPNRPDANDFAKASTFAHKIENKLQKKGSIKLEVADLPGNKELKPAMGTPAETPATNMDKCTLCNKCVVACPTSAITMNNTIHTRREACIMCMACIKACPHQAREAKTPFFNGIREKLFTNCAQRREPELFL